MSLCITDNPTIEYSTPYQVEECGSEPSCLKHDYRPKAACLEKKFALSEYKDYFWLAYHLGLNMGKRVEEGYITVNQAIEQLNTDFKQYAKKRGTDKNLSFTENFNRLCDKRVHLVVYEINQATVNLGNSILSDKIRDFYLLGGVEPYGRRGLANEFELPLFIMNDEKEPNIPEKLYDTGLLYDTQYLFKPWLYAVHNGNITITDFLSFVEDLRANFIEIGTKNLSTLDYLLCRVECWGKKGAGKRGQTHEETMIYFNRYLNKQHSNYTKASKQAITVLEYDNWLNLSNTIDGNFRTFKDKNSFLEYYCHKGSKDYKYLRQMFNYYLKTIGYSIDLSATLAVIELYKMREYNVGFTEKTTEGVAKEFGMSSAQLRNSAKQVGVLPYNFCDLYMRLFVLPVYKGTTYITLTDLCAEHSNVVCTSDSIIRLLKGDSLDFVFA